MCGLRFRGWWSFVQGAGVERERESEQKETAPSAADPPSPSPALTPPRPPPRTRPQFRAKLTCAALALALLGTSTGRSASFLRPAAAATPPTLVTVVQAAKAADKPAPEGGADTPGALDPTPGPVLYNVNPDGSA